MLISYVHREGSLGQQARSALLLCAAISSRNEAVADYIIRRSNMCLLLPTGEEISCIRLPLLIF